MSMARRDVFNIEWQGLQEFANALENMDDQVENIIMEEMTKFGMLAEEGAKALSPHDEGNGLEDSINFDSARKERGAVVVHGGSNSKYALRRHEEPYRMGRHDKGQDRGFYVDGRGRGTRGKPAWRGIQPGRKYMENAIKAIESDYDQMNARAMDRILRLGP